MTGQQNEAYAQQCTSGRNPAQKLCLQWVKGKNCGNQPKHHLFAPEKLPEQKMDKYYIDEV